MASGITIKDLSKLSGFSIATVSKALNDRSDISEKVKHKIKNLAAKVHYMPNNFAVALRNKKTNIIAIIVPQISTVYYAKLVSEIQSFASEKGFRIIILQSCENVKKEFESFNSISDGSVEGIIMLRTKLMQTSKFNQNVQILESNRIPFVIVNSETINSNTANSSGVGKKLFSWLLTQINSNNKIDWKSG